MAVSLVTYFMHASSAGSLACTLSLRRTPHRGCMVLRRRSLIISRSVGAHGSTLSLFIMFTAVAAACNFFEELALKSAPSRPCLWKRYVDDTCCILGKCDVDKLHPGAGRGHKNLKEEESHLKKTYMTHFKPSYDQP